MIDVEEYCPIDKQDWRNWLLLNHEAEHAIWLIFYKKKSVKHNLSWSDAVDEALCFGWIDSVKKSIDDEKFKQYFSKRKVNGTWSKVNKDKVDALLSENLIQEAGLKAIEVAKKNGSWTILDDVEALIVPEDFATHLGKAAGALEYFESLSNSDKKILLAWIAFAKRAETRQKRILEIAENASLGLKPKQFR